MGPGAAEIAVLVLEPELTGAPRAQAHARRSSAGLSRNTPSPNAELNVAGAESEGYVGNAPAAAVSRLATRGIC